MTEDNYSLCNKNPFSVSLEKIPNIRNLRNCQRSDVFTKGSKPRLSTFSQNDKFTLWGDLGMF